MGEKFTQIFQAFSKKRMWINVLLGFSAGLPIMMVYSTVKIWLRREGVDLSTIGFIGWIAIPYSLNFLMGPLLDRYVPTSLGRRRSWILVAQLGLTASILLLSFGDPSFSVSYIVLMGFAIAFFSATQDVAVDAYRREILPDNEIGIGSSIYVYGYRIAMWVTSGLALRTVDPDTWNFTFNDMFMMMAGIMALNIVTTFFATEPKREDTEPLSFTDQVVVPFREFFQRQGFRVAVTILSFIFLFKLGDAMVGSLLGPFYVDMGYSNKTIADVTKTIGLVSTLAGLGCGAMFMYYMSIVPSLIIFGILQMISTSLFSILTFAGFKGSWWALALVVGFEDFSSGLGTVALISFMAIMTNKNYTATQYALFASLASLGRTFFAGFAGTIVQTIGYVKFFYLGSALAIPGMVLIYFVWQIQKNESSDDELTPPPTNTRVPESNSETRDESRMAEI